MDDVLNSIKSKKHQLHKAKELGTLELALKEDLYIGNLHYANTAHARNNHSWTMFISSSPTDVVPTASVKSVLWHLHETFRPRRVKQTEPPFYLSRRGWGYFEVRADITFKAGFGPTGKHNKRLLTATHSIHFGSPLCSHHVLSHLPYLVTSPKLQQLVSARDGTQSLQRALRARVAAMRARSDRSLKARHEDDGEEQNEDDVTKQSIPELAFRGFILSASQMGNVLQETLADEVPVEVLQCIVEFGAFPSVLDAADFAECRLVLEACRNVTTEVASVHEVVLRECGECRLHTRDVARSIRLYDSTGIQIRCKGECTSHRFEKCKAVEVEFGYQLQSDQTVVFMSLFSEDFRLRMVSGDSFKTFPDLGAEHLLGKDDCYLIKYREKGADLSRSHFRCDTMSVDRGASLNEII